MDRGPDDSASNPGSMSPPPGRPGKGSFAAGATARIAKAAPAGEEPAAPLAASAGTDRRRRAAVWLQAFWPAPVAIDRRERLRIVAGTAIVVVITAVLCHLAGLPAALPWIVPPIGASALLVVGLPASPLAQPWAVVGGNTLSALIGVACARWIAPTDAAAATGIALSIVAMLVTRSLHPPGVAMALMMAVAGVTDPRAAFFPVMLNSLLLVAFGIAYNNATGRRYPHGQTIAPPASPGRVSEADLDAVLAHYNQLLDVSRDDLRGLLDEAQLRAAERRLSEKRCADLMSRDVACVEFGTPLQEAWTLLRRQGVKALPVIERSRRLAGIVTLSDFLKAADLDEHHGVGSRLRGLIRATASSHSSKPEVVGQIMSRPVRVAGDQWPLADLLPLFARSGHHHIPVIDHEQRLVGIVTQSDIVAALAAVETEAG